MNFIMAMQINVHFMSVLQEDLLIFSDFSSVFASINSLSVFDSLLFFKTLPVLIPFYQIHVLCSLESVMYLNKVRIIRSLDVQVH